MENVLGKKIENFWSFKARSFVFFKNGTIFYRVTLTYKIFKTSSFSKPEQMAERSRVQKTDHVFTFPLYVWDLSPNFTDKFILQVFFFILGIIHVYINKINCMALQQPWWLRESLLNAYQHFSLKLSDLAFRVVVITTF